MKVKKQTNDQGELIQDLVRKDFRSAWEKVKFVGYQDVPNFTERYLLFYHAANKFNPGKSNNFIYFYKQTLKRMKFDKYDTFFTTSSRGVIEQLKREAISPSVDVKSKNVVRELKKFRKPSREE